MDAHDLNLQTPATVWWIILIIGIAFIVGGLAIALNRIQDRRRPGWKDATLSPGPEGAGKSWAKALLTSNLGGRDPARYDARKVMDPNGPFPRCAPMYFVGGGCCRNCGFPIDDDSPNACRASNPKARYRIEWGVEPGFGLNDGLDGIDPSIGNVDLLTRGQVGIGWRIPHHGELPHRMAEVWHRTNLRWEFRCFDRVNPYQPHATYRVPGEGKE